MNDIEINWEGHVNKYQAAMEELNIDFCILTRVKSITYLSGCFVPWKSAILLPKRGNFMFPLWESITVPKIAVQKYNKLSFWKDDIRLAG